MHYDAGLHSAKKLFCRGATDMFSIETRNSRLKLKELQQREKKPFGGKRHSGQKCTKCTNKKYIIF